MTSLTPQAFVAKWRHVELKERSACQENFIDLCRLVNHPTPVEADPAGIWFTFEAGADKQQGSHGWPDNLSDDEILARLLALNLARAARQ